MLIDYTEQTVVVTGASRGIGLQIAKDLVECGATVIATSTHADAEHSIREATGVNTQYRCVDFADPTSLREFLAFLRDQPRLHALVNNAATTRHKPFMDVTPDDWDVTHDVDLRAPFFVSQAAATVMRRQGYGRIVNISSIWGHLTYPGRSVYTAAKFGLNGLSLNLALELARSNILVNIVSPGFTLTDMVRANYSEDTLNEFASQIPVGRLAAPTDVSKAVLFLGSALNQYVTGQNIVVDGGYSVSRGTPPLST